MDVLKSLNETRELILAKREEERIFDIFCKNVTAMAEAMKNYKITDISDMFLNCGHISF